MFFPKYSYPIIAAERQNGISTTSSTIVILRHAAVSFLNEVHFPVARDECCSKNNYWMCLEHITGFPFQHSSSGETPDTVFSQSSFYTCGLKLVLSLPCVLE
jgi:hypothetical protein